ncbi:hypothetical protein [Erwinia sp. CGal63]|uniref:hypothetical protein n=1 Tax=Erwinia sp. CGal63 TaxID=2919889 RepID=UPI0030083D86
MPRTKEQLIEELTSYIDNGYLDINSFDNPLDEAATALTELHFIDGAACEFLCKRIILSSAVGDAYLDSLCLGHLFDLNKDYALNYVLTHVENMPAPVLGSAMDGLYQYSEEQFRMKFSEELIAKIHKRYDEVVQDPFFKDMLASLYDTFSVTYSRRNISAGS